MLHAVLEVLRGSILRILPVPTVTWTDTASTGSIFAVSTLMLRVLARLFIQVYILSIRTQSMKYRLGPSDCAFFRSSSIKHAHSSPCEILLPPIRLLQRLIQQRRVFAYHATNYSLVRSAVNNLHRTRRPASLRSNTTSCM